MSESLDDPENVDLLVKNSPETVEFFDQLFKEAVDNPFGFVLFVADKAVIAITEVQSVVSFKLGTVASITALFVSKDGRGEGVEEILLEAAKTRAVDLGYGGIVFSTPTVGKWSDVAETNGFEPFMLHYVAKLNTDE
jgi:GNAT superfamily N-acetyltransferase